MDITDFIKWLLFFNIFASFVGIAKIQNEEEGGSLMTLLSLIVLGCTVGIPLFLVFFAFDIVGIVGKIKYNIRR